MNRLGTIISSPKAAELRLVSNLGTRCFHRLATFVRTTDTARAMLVVAGCRRVLRAALPAIAVGKCRDNERNCACERVRNPACSSNQGVPLAGGTCSPHTAQSGVQGRATKTNRLTD